VAFAPLHLPAAEATTRTGEPILAPSSTTRPTTRDLPHQPTSSCRPRRRRRPRGHEGGPGARPLPPEGPLGGLRTKKTVEGGLWLKGYAAPLEVLPSSSARARGSRSAGRGPHRRRGADDLRRHPRRGPAPRARAATPPGTGWSSPIRREGAHRLWAEVAIASPASSTSSRPFRKAARVGATGTSGATPPGGGETCRRAA